MTMTEADREEHADQAEALEDLDAGLEQYQPAAELTREPVDQAMEKWRSGEELEERRERLPESDAWDRMASMASKLAMAPTMPKHIRESRDPEADMMVILLTAHDLGLSATVALQKVNVIEGKPAMASELMRMLVRRDGHKLWCEIDKDASGSPRSVTWFGIRSDEPDRTHEATFSISDAVAAGLCSLKDGAVHARSSSGKRLPWEAYTEDMLSARATSRLCRRVFEDSLGGVSYTPEELGTITVEPVEPPAPADPLASDEDCADIRKQIEDLTDAERALVATKWKAAKIGSVSEGRKPEMRWLHESERAIASAMIAEAKVEAVEEAEIVVPPELAPHAFEGSATATECATCGRPRLDPLHPPEAEEPEEPDETPLTDAELEADLATTRQAISDRISAEIGKLTVVQLTDALMAANLSVEGAPKMRRARLLEHRYQEAMTSDEI